VRPSCWSAAQSRSSRFVRLLCPTRLIFSASLLVHAASSVRFDLPVYLQMMCMHCCLHPNAAREQCHTLVPRTEAAHVRSSAAVARCAVVLTCGAQLQVHCFVLECGGSEVAALAMAAGLAVADAQIDMRCVLSAACVVRNSG
jgi:hypothetical protein